MSLTPGTGSATMDSAPTDLVLTFPLAGSESLSSFKGAQGQAAPTNGIPEGPKYGHQALLPTKLGMTAKRLLLSSQSLGQGQNQGQGLGEEEALQWDD